MHTKLTHFLLFLYFSFSHCESTDYYHWREYRGEIPADALPAGNNTYIGQTYIHDYGIFIGQILPGQKHMDVQCYGVKRVDKNIKIFCTKNTTWFNWFPTSYKTFRHDVMDKCVINGGFNHKEEDFGRLSVGRVTTDGVVRVGAVASHSIKRPFLYTVVDNKQKKFNEFEVLLCTQY